MPRRKLPVVAPKCPYCTQPSKLTPDANVYARSYGGHVWLCRPCEAWVGCHRNSPRHAPLGRLAKAPLRALKIRAHAQFDALWMAAMRHRGWSKAEARLRAYAWLASELGVQAAHCHIGFFDEVLTQRTIELCGLYSLRARRNAQDVDKTCGKRVDTLCMPSGP